MIQYTCWQCDHRFQRVALLGEAPEPTECLRCGAGNVHPESQSTRLFKGISRFSPLAKDTN